MIELVFVMILGLCIGSFLNVCIYRLPREESIAFPPSHCTSCDHKLKWYELIPIVSYIILKGKCKKCSEKISIQYPIIEFVNGILYVLVFLRFEYTIDTIKFMILVSAMLVIGIIDFKTKFVYTSTTIVLGIVGAVFIILEWFTTKTFPLDKILGFAIGFAIIGLIVLITGGMGEGDIDIAAVSGLFLGVKGTVFMLFSAVILGGIVAAIILISNSKKRKSEIAFGPFLATGTLFAIFYGELIINYYLNFCIM